MGVYQSRIECMWLPAQSGKTRKCMERIVEMENREKELQTLIGLHNTSANSLNIIVCSNNRVLVDQTSARMNKDLPKIRGASTGTNASASGAEAGAAGASAAGASFTIYDEEAYYDARDEEEINSDADISNKVFAWRSGLKNHNKSVEALCLDILEGKVETIICCSHPIRLKYLYQLCDRLNQSSLFKRYINIWIDEADVSIQMWSKPALNVFNFKKVDKVTLISATFDSIIKKYGRIKIIPFADTHSEVYHKIQESTLILKDYLTKGSLDYLTEVFKHQSAELCMPGTRLFAPGDVKRESHDAIATFLQAKGFVVVIVNGERKVIIGIPGKGPISLNSQIEANGDPVEIGNQIAKIYVDNNLHQWPFAITGNLCLGRGITFQNENFLFNWGIIPFIADKATAYQVVSRTNGNIKHLPNYAPVKLIMTDKMCKQVISHENLAINIARTVHEKISDDPYYDGFICQEDIKDLNDPQERRRMEVPMMFHLTDEEFAYIEQNPIEKEKNIRSIIRLKHMGLYMQIYTYKCIQVTTPNSENSYKKHILDVEKKVQAQEKFVMDIPKAHKSINSCQFYIDDKKKRVFVIVYRGAE
jgi:hypothetical protein